MEASVFEYEVCGEETEVKISKIYFTLLLDNTNVALLLTSENFKKY